jgi:transcriptional regulator with PAS, ATPase and Fis domain
VLIQGESGTGKELIAKVIHQNSSRKEGPFIPVNCGAITPGLMESELFGHKKGSFSGAIRDKIGLFKEADGGTIFLDEIADAPLTTQAAILRVIQNGEIRPIGASKTEFVDVRIISATNKDLRELIKTGEFREDLYYRLNTFIIELPSLSQRRDDIPLLIAYFLNKLKITTGKENLAVTPAAMDCLIKYAWPGNVRQLEHELERAAVICDSDNRIDIEHLSLEVGCVNIDSEKTVGFHGKLRDIVEKVEKQVIAATLKEFKGNILQASKVLGLTRKGLKDKMSRYQILPDKKNNDVLL